MFDDLLLLAEGRVIYQGEGRGAIPYFSKLDFKCPIFVNPADFLFMAILNNEDENVSNDSHSSKSLEESPKEDNKARINRLLLCWTDSEEGKIIDQTHFLGKQIYSESNIDIKKGISSEIYKTKSSFFVQYGYLFTRASKNAFRDPLSMFL